MQVCDSTGAPVDSNNLRQGNRTRGRGYRQSAYSYLPSVLAGFANDSAIAMSSLGGKASACDPESL